MKTAATFVVAGASWILLTDALLYWLGLDPVQSARLETAKGWAFVGLVGMVIYALLARYVFRLSRARAVISAVIESIGDGVLLLGPDRTIVHANPAAMRMLRAGREELEGVGAVEFVRRFRVSYPDGSLVPPDRLSSQRVFDEGGPLQYKAVLNPPGAPELVISSTAAAVRDEVGEPARLVVSVLHDITASEHLDRLRDQFFAAAAHSLKTPVAIIKGNAQLLGRCAAPEQRRSTAAIERQCGRIDRLVQNLLILARHRSSTLRLHPTELELAPLVEQVVREMSSASAAHEVLADIADSPRIHADPECLATALRNLIDEALRTSPSGSPVTVTLRSDASDAEVGVRHRLLPPEERIPDANPEYDELGVSRCVLQMIVQAHGGALREEPDGSETTAWVRLPAALRADGP